MLIRDPNKIVGVAVLSSPKITEAEIENIAKMANVSDEIPRMIGFSRNWTKSYAIVHALTKNPEDAARDVDELPVAAGREGFAEPLDEPEHSRSPSA